MNEQVKIEDGKKFCFKCSSWKYVEEFAKEKRILSGFSSRCLECRKSYFREWRRNHPQLSAQYTNKYRKNNIEKSRASVRRYRKGRAHIWDHKRRVLELESGTYTLQEWESLLKKFDYKCLACGSLENLSVDHVIPLSKGGSNTIDNIQPLCRSCNSKKHAKTVDYRTCTIKVGQ